MKKAGYVFSGLGIWIDEQVIIYRGRLVAVQEVIFPWYDFDNVHLNNFSFNSKQRFVSSMKKNDHIWWVLGRPSSM